MHNEQCGICWNLKFDNQGEQTHSDLKNTHNFVSLDYCVKCKEPEYNQSGFQSHSDETYYVMLTQTSRIPHKFISGIEAEYQEKQRKKKHVFTFIGIVSIGVILTTSLSNLFF
ncbi:MAG TPA: hypothetical protein VMW55_02465 [Nitrosopumilaceae archaeon]|jgi:hypothetical protein|nr:hypothetical protein [Nitrosopumilaceae archaeon]